MTPERTRLAVTVAAGIGLILLLVALPTLQQAAPGTVVYILAAEVIGLFVFWFAM